MFFPPFGLNEFRPLKYDSGGLNEFVLLVLHLPCESWLKECFCGTNMKRGTWDLEWSPTQKLFWRFIALWKEMWLQNMFTSFTTTRSDSTLICTYLTNPCQCWRRLYEQNDGAAVKQGKRGKDSESKLRFSNSGLTLGLIPAGLLLLRAVGTAACAWLCNF